MQGHSRKNIWNLNSRGAFEVRGLVQGQEGSILDQWSNQSLILLLIDNISYMMMKLVYHHKN